jgi:hypothetical protein
MNDIAGVAQNLTHVLQAMGVDEPAAKASEIGNTVFKQCGGEFPFIAARVAGLLADSIPAQNYPYNDTSEAEVVDPEPETDTTSNEETE